MREIVHRHLGKVVAGAAVAVAGTAVMVGITATGGFIGHASVGHWEWRTSLIAAVAVFMGAQIGSRLSVSVDKERLKSALSVFLLLAAVLLALRAACPA